MPLEFDVHFRNAFDCIRFIKGYKGKIEHISFDHDLGDEDKNGTGYDVAVALEEMAYNNKISKISYAVHSANPVGRKRIDAAMKFIQKNYW